jgi:cytoskeletal protein CcmA (bactofilin family)
VKWGKPVAIALFVLLAVGVGVLNLTPLSTEQYEKLASQALGQPVKIGSARMWVLAGVQMRFENVVIGEGVKIAQVRAVPELGALFGEQKVFSRIELEKVVLPQEALGGALFGALQGAQFFARRVVASEVRLEGPVALPQLNADAAIGSDGRLAEAKLSGERLRGLITPRGDGVMFELTVESFALPFLNKLELTEFGAKGTANRQGMTVTEFDGRVFDGTMAGNARIQWGPTWSVSGDVRGGGMNAGVFAASLVSEGRFEGKGHFVMAGKEPARLYETARLDGNFTVARGTLSSFDLSRALQTTSAQASGRTQFTELTGQVALASGTLALRDLRLTAGLLNATGSLDIEPAGSISGRINAELRNLRGTYYIGGKLTEPQLRK